MRLSVKVSGIRRGGLLRTAGVGPLQRNLWPSWLSGADVSAQAALALADISAQSGVSLSTLRRKQRTGEFPEAFKDDGGRWRVPVSDLHAAGVRLTPALNHERVPNPEPAAVEPAEVVELRHRVKLLEAQLRAEQEKNDLLSQSLADLRSALRAIEPPKSPAPQGAPDPEPINSEPRCPWLARLFGGQT